MRSLDDCFRLVVSVHDVAPSRLGAVVGLLAELDRLGVRPRVLKVIPAEPGAGSAAYAALFQLLRAEQAAGSEVVLHGWSHRVEHRIGGLGPRAVRSRLFAPHDAEFMSLAPDEAGRRLVAGREALAAAGLAVDGFCAPGWLAAAWLPGLLAALGFGHYIGMAQLRDLRRGRRTWLPWAGQVGAGPVHEALVGLASRGSIRLGARRSCVKVFLHPTPGAPGPPIRRTLDLTRRLLRSRRPTTYADLLA